MIYDDKEEPLIKTPKKIPTPKCNHCPQTFQYESKRYEHQRDVHGDMTGWIEGVVY